MIYCYSFLQLIYLYCMINMVFANMCQIYSSSDLLVRYHENHWKLDNIDTTKYYT